MESSEHPKNPANVVERKNEKRELSDADHRILGQRLDLFSVSEEAGIGLVLWHPKGAIVRNVLRDFWEKELVRNGYQLVYTPHIARKELWQTSGHLEYYRDNMYLFEKDGECYVVRPMNCPLQIQIYKSRPRSYRDLPIRYAEWGTVYRYERSGTLHGMLRVRGFTQDDAHIFCTREQVEQEMLGILSLAQKAWHEFGFTEYRARLSTRDPERPEDFMGNENDWRNAENALASAMKKKGIRYSVAVGEAVFYGPKVDINIVDSAGREWQCTTAQVDFNLPGRFNIDYVGADGQEHEVVLIHRAILGSIERFFAVLLEHHGGNLPVWLAPTQVTVIPVSHDYCEYAEQVHKKLTSRGIRAELDSSGETIGYKVRQAELQKIPYMAICGKREAESRKLAVRKHGVGNLGSFTVQGLAATIREESGQQGHSTD